MTLDISWWLMKYRNIFLLINLFLFGCTPKFTNDLPNDCQLSSGDLLKKIKGSYYFEDEKGVRHDFEIGEDGSLKKEKNPNEPSEKVKWYKIGNHIYASRKLVNNYEIYKIKLNKTQIVVYDMSEDFFKKNPNCIPGIVFSKSSDVEKIEASSEKIKNFLLLNEDSPNLFLDKPILLFNRINEKMESISSDSNSNFKYLFLLVIFLVFSAGGIGLILYKKNA